MKVDRLKASILANAEEIGRLKARIRESVRLRFHSAEDGRNWERACQEFHSRYDELAFPGGYADALQRIAAGEPDAIEAALCFLEVRPFFFRSGYMFRDILRKTKRAPLSKPQADRLASIVAAYEQYRAQRSRKA
jgi:hypothetical protein